ncbi:Isy1-like splicing factor [Yamadazyma tenuis ATCC 10573]|uniref:Pre-mRNA-splicing factor ISY1 n=2 Tax=Candida tenuis TaxID=2315449 RepID=G3BA19_CANTC|nr:Isy1-like splicing factor [Yamadazyma tenuis ATCC 10573]EGV61991.1 Isy1-like splicing factor [Yamadazyma tenuis ATCC 10573]
MSRNKEKAQSALNRYQQEVNRQAGVLETNPNLRPKYVQSVESLPQAEKWRSVVITEISTRLTRIQDPLLEESQIRELNETLNKLMSEKRAWEHHIKSLGGADYLRFGPKFESMGMMDNDISGIKGFRYFGRAKDLPEVKLLQQAKIDKATRESTQQDTEQREVQELEMRFSNLDPTYYSTFTRTNIYDKAEDDLIAIVGDVYTRQEERKNVEAYNFKAISKSLSDDIQNTAKDMTISQAQLEEIMDYSDIIPSEEDIKQWVLDQKKQQLLAKLASSK